MWQLLISYIQHDGRTTRGREMPTSGGRAWPCRLAITTKRILTAMCLQSAWRAHKVRQQVAHLRRENAAVVLQKTWRRHAAVSAYRTAILCAVTLLYRVLCLGFSSCLICTEYDGASSSDHLSACARPAVPRRDSRRRPGYCFQYARLRCAVCVAIMATETQP